MLLVADSSALLGLASCEGLPLLDSLFEAVQVPPAVFSECTVTGQPYSQDLRNHLQDKVVPVDVSDALVRAALEIAGEL